MEKMNRIIYIALALAGMSSCVEPLEIDLSGRWELSLDTADAGLRQQWLTEPATGMISLPGSLQEQGYGFRPGVETQWTGQIVDSSWFRSERYAPYRRAGNIKLPFWLQPDRVYAGVAWYRREVEIPRSWRGKYVELELERTHWSSTLFVNGREAGNCDALSAPHRYAVEAGGKLSLALRVDNRVNIPVGVNAHSVSDHTQTNWNGIVGRIRLAAKPAMHVERLTVYPDIAERKAVVEVNLSRKSPVDTRLKLYVDAFNNRGPSPRVQPVSVTVRAGSAHAMVDVDMGPGVRLWSEHDPNLYRLRAELTGPDGVHRSQTVFGMREITVEGTRFHVNGAPIFLRGTLDCCIFPLTGYPPATERYWEKIFMRCREFGLNHVRFHSWCPPEAAFNVADRLGVYLQVECGAWTSVGNGDYLDRWLYAESERIVCEYGNHPSFCMMLYGNEPGGRNQVEWLSDFVSYWKHQDPRRLYSGGAGWPDLDAADFRSSPEPRIQAWGAGLSSRINSQAPETRYDWREIIAKEPRMPVVSHETGQWCAFPNLSETYKYSGVLKPRNYEIFAETLSANRLGGMADRFLMASGMLQMLCYKADIEAALRTPGFAGFQLLGLYDFPGQGTAPVGVLDAFWDPKPYASGETYRRFCNSTVLLARMDKMVFSDADTFRADIEAAHFGARQLDGAVVEWRLVDKSRSEAIYSSEAVVDLPVGNCIPAGSLEIPLAGVKVPAKLSLEARIAGTSYANDWNIWVYSSKDNYVSHQDDVYITDDVNMALPAAAAGGNVIYCLPRAALKPESGGDIAVGFSPIFWNTAWTRNQAPHTLGLYCEDSHPALASFPHNGHSDYQWWEIITGSAPILLDDFPPTMRPIVWLIDDWFANRRLALVAEGRLGNGRIIISGADLVYDLDKRHSARQLLHSLAGYIKSDRFGPAEQLSEDLIKNLLK
jgi:hypothetical protein